MKITTLPFRTAVVNNLNLGTGVVYLTKKIPVFEEIVTVDTTRPVPTIGKYTAYILLINQTANNDPMNKCTHNEQVTIQIQCVTKWPSGTGSSGEAERIAQLVLDRLFPASDIKPNLTLSNDLDLWKGEVMSILNLNYADDANHVWNTIITLLCRVMQ